MKDSNIEVDIIDESLLYICIDGKREHISVDNARIKYAKNQLVLNLIDSVLERYLESSSTLEPAKESREPKLKENSEVNIMEELNSKPLESVEIDLGNNKKSEPSSDSLEALNRAPLTPPSRDNLNKKNLEKSKIPSLRELDLEPLEIVDEAKYASIYEKYNSRIRETFPTDSPSFLDVEKLARNSKPLEPTK